MLLLYLEEVKIHSFVPPKDKVINVSGKRLAIAGRFFVAKCRELVYYRFKVSMFGGTEEEW